MKPGNANATSHGAYSETGLRGRKTGLKRRFLKARGTRESELDPAGLQLLDDYAAVAAKVEALDEWFEQNGLFDAKGEPAAPTRFYVAVVNSMQRERSRLEDHLSKSAGQTDPFDKYRNIPDEEGDDDGD
jgi:hypothetical protein